MSVAAASPAPSHRLVVLIPPESVPARVASFAQYHSLPAPRTHATSCRLVLDCDGCCWPIVFSLVRVLLCYAASVAYAG